MQDADCAPRPWCVSQPDIASQQRTIQNLGEGDVSGVVGSQVGAELKGPPHQGKRRIAVDVDQSKIVDGGRKSTLCDRACQPAFAKHRDGLDINEIWSGEIPRSSNFGSRLPPLGTIVSDDVGQDGRVDDNQSRDRSSAMSLTA